MVVTSLRQDELRARQGLWISPGRPHRTEIFVGAAPACIRILRGFPACCAYVDGGWFKARNGLTEVAKTMLLKLQCYFNTTLTKRCVHMSSNLSQVQPLGLDHCHHLQLVDVN